jgi:integrase
MEKSKSRRGKFRNVFARSGQGTLYIRFKGPNGWEQRSTEWVVGQEALAAEALEKLNAHLATGGADVDLGHVGPITVERWFTPWIRKRERRFQTWKNDESVFRLHVLPSLGKMRLEEVCPRHVDDLVDSWRDKMAQKSVHNAYSSVRAFFRDACLRGHIKQTPCILGKEQLGPKEPKDSEFRDKAKFKRAELETLISDEQIPMDRRVLYALEGVAGLRHGEAAGLRFRNCDRQPEEGGGLGMIYVAFSYGRAYPKGGKCRPVPVHPTLAAMLAEWRMHGWAELMGRKPTDDDLVVPLPPEATSKKGPFRTKGYSYDRFEQDLQTLGFRHRRGHDLRRTFISLARSDGARSDILRRATHKPPPEVIEGYTSFEWEVVCAEVAKLKIQRRGTADVVAIPRASAVGDRPFAAMLHGSGPEHGSTEVAAGPTSTEPPDAPVSAGISNAQPLRIGPVRVRGGPLEFGREPAEFAKRAANRAAKLRGALTDLLEAARRAGLDPTHPAMIAAAAALDASEEPA